MKLRELLELQDRTETNNVIVVHEDETCHLFISDEDYANFDLGKFGDAEVLYFSAQALDEFTPYLSITCRLEKSPAQTMQETVDEFFDYLDECSNNAGFVRERPGADARMAEG